MNKIIKNIKSEFSLLLLLALIVIPGKTFAYNYSYDPDYKLQQSVENVYYINDSYGYGNIIVKFKNEIGIYNDKSTIDNNNPDNYVLTDSNGSTIQLSSISGLQHNSDLYWDWNNTQVYNYLGVYNNVNDQIGNAVSLNTYNLPSGQYKLCVKNIQSLSYSRRYDSSNHYIEAGDPMQQQCINFNTDNKIIGAYPHYNGGNNGSGNPSNGIIEIATNFVIGYGYGYGENYVFKDSNNNIIKGSDITCYKDNSKSPKIDDSGHPFGNILIKDINANTYWSDKSIMIDVGCPLPNGNYKICVSNIKDIYGNTISGEQCVDFSNTPKLIKATQIDGALNAIRLTFDNSFELKNSSSDDIIIEDSYGNPLQLNDSQLNLISNSYVYSKRKDLNFMDVDFTEDYVASYYYSPSIENNILLPAGNYKICVKNIRYTPVPAYDIGHWNVDNNIYDTTSGQCKDITIVDKVRPFLTGNSDEFVNNGNYLAYNNKITIKYSEKMKESTVLDTRNYMIKDYDNNGDGIADVNNWTSLSSINGAYMYFDGDSNDTSYGKNVVISFKNNTKINLLNGQTDLMIGNASSPDTHKITDLSENPFVYTSYLSSGPILYPYAINENMLVMSNIDLSSEQYIKKIEIMSGETIRFTFNRAITNINPDEFTISIHSNNVAIDSASIIANNIVEFKMEDQNVFTSSDTLKSIKLSTNSVSESVDEFNLPFLSASTFNGSLEYAIFVNYLAAPELKSAVMLTPNSILLGISGDIKNFDSQSLDNLSQSIIITQKDLLGRDKILACYGYGCTNVNASCVASKKEVFAAGTSGSGSGGGNSMPSMPLGYMMILPGLSAQPKQLDNVTTYFVGYIYGVNFMNKDFTVKTKSNDDIKFQDQNGHKLKENTAGITGHYGSLYLNDFSSDGYAEANIAFSINIDKDTIIPNGKWDIFNPRDYENNTVINGNSTRCYNAPVGSCFIQKVDKGVMFDLVNNKIFFPGTNIGYIKYDNNSYNFPTKVEVENLYVVFNQRFNTITLYFDYKNQDDEDNMSDIMDNYMNGASYIPGDIRSLSGKQIDSNLAVGGYFEFDQ